MELTREGVDWLIADELTLLGFLFQTTLEQIHDQIPFSITFTTNAL